MATSMAHNTSNFHSSFDIEIPALKHHPLLQTSSSDLTSSFADASDVAANLTPSTASSVYSDAEHASRSRSPPKVLAQHHSRAAMPAPRNPLMSVEQDHGAAVPDRIASTPPRSPSTTTSMMLDTPIQLSHGQKRTASGEMKWSESPKRFQTPQIALPGISARQRSKTVDSADSNMNRIAEVSAQLRAKLSYAAAKVESQWQLRSPDNKLRYSPASSSARPSPYPSNAESDGRVQPPNALATCVGLDGNNGPSHAPATVDISQIPRLAPPADIIAGNGNVPRRRPNPNLANQSSHGALKSPYTHHFPRPTLSQQSSASSSNTNLLIPGTPPYSQHPLSQRMSAPTGPRPQRTPSQNALMEQDAIETLLFMSSPENSGYRANSRIPVQPSSFAPSQLAPVPTLQSQSSIDSPARQRRVGFADQPEHAPLHVNRTRTGHLSNGVTRSPYPGDDIDRMLDEMPDSDSDMDDWLPHQRPSLASQADASRMVRGTHPNASWPSLQ